MAVPLIDPELFDQLKNNIEEDVTVKKEVERLVDELSLQVAFTQALLTRIHSTPRSKYESLLPQVEEGIRKEIQAIQALAAYASKYPFYKYSFKWSRQVQDAVSTVLMCAWLGGMAAESRTGELGRLLQLDEVGKVLGVPVNLKDEDAFHITIEDYLLALINNIDDLARLAMNSVTMGDNDMAVRISGFIKDLHAGFQVLNLKNDILRKRVDSIKYSVKKVEDVVYDLSLRNLIPAKMEE